ncbi:MAG: hypothetical protein EB059_09565 [Alphaproteobacteria bacterium]|nr:hypothetical protein [Alphaproteobacteria bacterium]
MALWKKQQRKTMCFKAWRNKTMFSVVTDFGNFDLPNARAVFVISFFQEANETLGQTGDYSGVEIT